MELHRLDLNLLVAFDALMAERNVTRAAKRIGRTQPGMSATLARLRALLKDELFVRGPNGLQPTRRAAELAEPIAKALGELQKTLSFTQDFEPAIAAVTFTLGLSAHAETAALPRLVSILGQRAPGIDLQVRGYAKRDDAIQMLDHGEVDLTIGLPPTESGRIVTERLFQERFVCILRNDHPEMPSILDRETFLSFSHVLVSPDNEGLDVADAALATKGMSRRAAVTVSQMSSALELVARTDMIATVLESSVANSVYSDRLTTFEFPLPLNPVPFSMSWHRRNDNHLAQRWLRTCLLGAFPHVWHPSEQICPDLNDQYY